MTRRSSTYTISIIGILGALIILQAYIPMVGYITVIPGLPAISTIHLTVILGAVVLGPRAGGGLGLLWGLISLLRAYTSPTSPLTILLFQNPVIAIVPRVMTGLVAGWIFNYVAKKVTTGIGGTVKMILAGVCGALTNTLLVIAFTWVFYATNASKVVSGANATDLGWLLMGALAINAVSEAVMAGIVTPILGQVLLRFKK